MITRRGQLVLALALTIAGLVIGLNVPWLWLVIK